MNVALFNVVIMIQKRDVTTDDIGNHVSTWHDFYKCHATISAESGSVQAADGTKYLVIHSGSRNLGKQVAEFYQQLAIDLHSGKEEYFKMRDEIIRTYKEQGRRTEIQGALKALKNDYETKNPDVPEDLCWLYGEYLEDYLHDVEICQAVCDYLGWELEIFGVNWDEKLVQLDSFECDCVWSGMTILDSMKEAGYVISEPYYDNTQVLVVKSDSGYASSADLAGKVVAVQLGGTVFIQRQHKAFMNAELARDQVIVAEAVGVKPVSVAEPPGSDKSHGRHQDCNNLLHDKILLIACSNLVLHRFSLS